MILIRCLPCARRRARLRCVSVASLPCLYVSSVCCPAGGEAACTMNGNHLRRPRNCFLALGSPSLCSGGGPESAAILKLGSRAKLVAFGRRWPRGINRGGAALMPADSMNTFCSRPSRQQLPLEQPANGSRLCLILYKFEVPTMCC